MRGEPWPRPPLSPCPVIGHISPMAEPSHLPEPDAAEGVPHPRLAERLFGHAQAQAEFVDALRSGRMHHAWLITGPRGIGKATLAWKLAAYLLSHPAGHVPGPSLFGEDDPSELLETDPDSPVRRRLAALSEPGLLLVRRGPNDKGDRLETQITVKVVRKLKDFFHLSATEGGRRVVIVDPADELNPNAANALLKELEEPPKDAVFFILSHQPQRLLPTIRSRCRVLRLGPLDAPELAAALEQAGIDPGEDQAELAALSSGSAGEAARLLTLDGLKMWHSLMRLMSRAPGFDRQMAMALSEGFSGRDNEQKLDLFLSLLELLLARLAKAGIAPGQTGAGSQAELDMLMRLSPDARAASGWAEAAYQLLARARHGRSVNLDPASLILDTLLKIDEAASALALR